MKILLTGAYKYTEGQLSRLKALGADFLYVEDEREELSFDVSAVDAVVCNGLFLYNDIKKFKNLMIKTTKLNSILKTLLKLTIWNFTLRVGLMDF